MVIFSPVVSHFPALTSLCSTAPRNLLLLREVRAGKELLILFLLGRKLLWCLVRGTCPDRQQGPCPPLAAVDTWTRCSQPSLAPPRCQPHCQSCPLRACPPLSLGPQQRCHPLAHGGPGPWYQGMPGPGAPPSWAQLDVVELMGHFPDFTLPGAQSEQRWGGRLSWGVLPTSPASLFSLEIFSHCVPLSVSKATLLWTCHRPQSVFVEGGRSNLQSFSWSFAAFDRAVGGLLVGCSPWSRSLLQQRGTSTTLGSSQSIPRTTRKVPSALEEARAEMGVGGSCWLVAFRRGCEWEQGGTDVADRSITRWVSGEVALGEGQHALSHL